MTEAYDDALAEQAKQNVWSNLADEAAGMSKLDYLTAVADIAGIFDPTPVSDTVGALLSLAQGDLAGAGLSVAGYLPYLGDVGKIAKIGKYAPRTAAALNMLATKSGKLANEAEEFLTNNFALNQIAMAREKAAARVRKALLDAKSGTPCKDCAKLPDGGKGRLQMPSTKGKWNTPDGSQPLNGNGTFTLSEPVTLPDGSRISSIDYREGFPNFDDHTLDGKHTLWKVSGKVASDRRELTKMMRKTNPNYKAPDPDLYTLHHFEDGTVGYVPKTLHGRAEGFPHSGGNTILNNDLF